MQMCLESFCQPRRLKLSFLLLITWLSLQPHLENNCKKKKKGRKLSSSDSRKRQHQSWLLTSLGIWVLLLRNQLRREGWGEWKREKGRGGEGRRGERGEEKGGQRRGGEMTGEWRKEGEKREGKRRGDGGQRAGKRDEKGPESWDPEMTKALENPKNSNVYVAAVSLFIFPRLW